MQPETLLHLRAVISFALNIHRIHYIYPVIIILLKVVFEHDLKKNTTMPVGRRKEEENAGNSYFSPLYLIDN